MKNITKLLGAGLCFFPLAASSEGNDPDIAVDTAGQVDISWDGVEGRTYFMQWSTDLVNWGFFPLIESGDGSPLSYGFESDADKFFIRLKYTDQTTTDPAGDDFDGDGVKNSVEISSVPTTDPFMIDTDGNGIDDAGSIDTDGDGIPNTWELANGYDPAVADGEAALAAYHASLASTANSFQVYTFLK